MRLEVLEQRVMLHGATGHAPTDTFSYDFLPDGTPTFYGEQSALFEQFNALAATSDWQRDFARALQVWTNHSNLNFYRADGDAADADIRFASIPNNIAVAFESVGDIVLNRNSAFRLDQYFRTLMVHEVGHFLGFHHVDSADSVMNPRGPSLPGILGARDIASVQLLYGARQHDVFDVAASNDAFDAASPVDAANASLMADVTTRDDMDYYRTTIPEAVDRLSVAVDARQLSLLAPRVSVYDASHNLVATASGDYGGLAQVEFAVNAGETYYLVADGALDGEFDIGAYRLDVHVTSAQETPSPTAPAVSDPDVDSSPLAEPGTVGTSPTENVTEPDPTTTPSTGTNAGETEVDEGDSAPVATSPANTLIRSENLLVIHFTRRPRRAESNEVPVPHSSSPVEADNSSTTVIAQEEFPVQRDAAPATEAPTTPRTLRDLSGRTGNQAPDVNREAVTHQGPAAGASSASGTTAPSANSTVTNVGAQPTTVSVIRLSSLNADPHRDASEQDRCTTCIPAPANVIPPATPPISNISVAPRNATSPSGLGRRLLIASSNWAERVDQAMAGFMDELWT